MDIYTNSKQLLHEVTYLDNMDNKLAGATGENGDGAQEKRPALVDQVGVLMDINTFREKVESGEISDDTGLAELYINGAPSNYHIHIDRRCVTRGDGTLITAVGIMKMYRPEDLSVLYKKRSKKMMTIAQYKRMMRARDKKQGKKSWI